MQTNVYSLVFNIDLPTDLILRDTGRSTPFAFFSDPTQFMPSIARSRGDSVRRLFIRCDLSLPTFVMDNINWLHLL